MTERTPQYQDDVKHKKADVSGTVIAKYPGQKNSETLLDVWGFNNKIFYGTPAKNWTVIRTHKEKRGG